MKRKDWKKYNKLKYNSLFPKASYYNLKRELKEELLKNNDESFIDISTEITNLYMPQLVSTSYRGLRYEL